MIPFDFEYYAPESVEEAAGLYAELAEKGKEPLYYSGGTEIVTFARAQTVKTGALVDIKGIPETTVLELDDEKLVLGANLTLTMLAEQDHFPLLAAVAGKVADRTVRNRLTLGGNICGRLPYREAILPLLAADAGVVLAGKDGSRSEPLGKLFDKRLKLEKGEMLVQLTVSLDELDQKGWNKRRVKHGPVDYPLLHLAGLQKNGRLALAVSGLCAFPFRSDELEKTLNDSGLSADERVEKSLDLLPGPVRSDEYGSDDYRRTLWQKDLVEMLGEMEGAGR